PSNTKAYITNASNSTISVCNIAVDGTLSSCEDANPGALETPFAITINPSNTFAYVTAPNAVFYCPIQPDGTFGGQCTISDNSFAYPAGIALNSVGDTAYVGDAAGNKVYDCPIKEDGSLDTCTDTDFTNPVSIAIG
ncbi:MAG: hypothetical protein K5Q00_04600, partial [Gammaproteobacteria bacterium]|nr:hypothetical protein [Gammaproteobacteria bacterium]